MQLKVSGIFSVSSQKTVLTRGSVSFCLCKSSLNLRTCLNFSSRVTTCSTRMQNFVFCIFAFVTYLSTVPNYTFALFFVLFINWLDEDVTGSWKCTDGGTVPQVHQTSFHDFQCWWICDTFFLRNVVFFFFEGKRCTTVVGRAAGCALLMPLVCLIASSPVNSYSKRLWCFKKWNRWDRLPFSDTHTKGKNESV